MTITGLLIDPVARTITPWQYADWQSIAPALHCETFATLSIDADTDDTLYLDDNGLSVSPLRYFFTIDGSHALAGRGILLGADQDGETRSPVLAIDQLRSRVNFYTVIGRTRSGTIIANHWTAADPAARPKVVPLPLDDEETPTSMLSR